jgi:site-specific DNA recombinase
LLDFTRMLSVFEKHVVSFVAVTQQFNTGTSLRRLTLNILFEFRSVRAGTHRLAHARQDGGSAAEGEMGGRVPRARL